MASSHDSGKETRAVLTPDGPVGVSTQRLAGPPGGEWIEYELSPEHHAELREFLGPLPLLAARYISSVRSTIDVEHLDDIFTCWQADKALSRLPLEQVARALGTHFGNILCQDLELRWVITEWPDHASLAVRHDRVGYHSWPISSVWKRIHSGEHRFFAAIKVNAAQRIHALLESPNKSIVPTREK